MTLSQLALLQLIEDGVALALEIPTGILADTLGRKTSLLIGIGAQIAGTLLIWKAPGFMLTAAGSALIALGDTFRSGADEALFYETHVELGEVSLYPLRFGRWQACGFISLVVLELAGARLASRAGENVVWATELAMEIAGFISAAGLVETAGGHAGTCSDRLPPTDSSVRGDERITRCTGVPATLGYVGALTVVAGLMGTMACMIELSWAGRRGAAPALMALLSVARHVAEAAGAWWGARQASEQSEATPAPLRRLAAAGVLLVLCALGVASAFGHGIAGAASRGAPGASLGLAASLVAMALVGLAQGAVGPLRSARINAAAPSAWRATLLSAATAAERLLRALLTLILVSALT